MLSSLNLNDGDFVNTLSFDLKGKSNESLGSLNINGLSSSLSNDLSFTQSLYTPVEGTYPIKITASDLAGNITEVNFSVEVVLKVLNGDLITLMPDSSDISKIIVKGMKGASRPNVKIDLDAGFLNREEVISNSDGSFEISMKFFQDIILSATDYQINRTDTVRLNYNVDTTLSGIVKDSDKNPLPGVGVSIYGTNQTTVTDSSGVFSIPNPLTGDQTLVIDGTSIPVNVTGPNRKFSKTSMTVSIGVTQLNALDRPIYLSPVILDGTETEIPDDNTAVVVTSPHAPGVELYIPAGATTFPDGIEKRAISIQEISSDATTIPPVDFAVPETVYALEPSGVSFSQSVELILPNDNDLPPGSEVIIFSKNSEDGTWDIDGAAQVTDDGGSIRTKEGEGISHFSEVYAVPLPPKISEFEKGHLTDTFNGALTNSIKLPSYKSLGSDRSPTLIYNSLWANPSALVSALLEVPDNHVSIPFAIKTKRSLFSSSGGAGQIDTWVQPESVKVQFKTYDQTGAKVEYRDIPNYSVVSYKMPLSDIESGIYPYSAKYEIRLKRIKITTIQRAQGSLFSYKQSLSSSRIESQIAKVFPLEVAGSYKFQNKIHSPVGRGWEIAGKQRILNPDDERLLIEEADGSLTEYAANNTVENIHKAVNNLVASDLSDPYNVLVLEDNNQLTEINIENKSSQYLNEVEYFQGNFGWVDSFPAWPGAWFCYERYVPFNRYRWPKQLFRADRNVFATDVNGQIFRVNLDSTATSKVVGQMGQTPNNWIMPEYDFCGKPGTFCRNKTVIRDYPAIGCYWPVQGTGQVQVQGFNDGWLDHGAVNRPWGITAGADPKTLIFADHGNHRVRKINLETSTISTIAGNGQTYNNGNGGPALQASIYHPKGVLLDSVGNIYVSVEAGEIRKISPQGQITNFAGNSSGGGVLANSGYISDLVLNDPTGMVIDEVNDFFYIADTGHHRVIQINLLDKSYKTIAGSGQCHSEDVSEGKPALLTSLCLPEQLGLDADKNLLVEDKGHGYIRRVLLNHGTNSEFLTYLPMKGKGTKVVKLADNSFRREYRDGGFSYFNTDGLHTSSESRNGRYIDYSYDAGKLVTVTDSVGNQETYSYNNDLLQSITDPAGRVTTFEYDVNLLTKVNFPDGSTRQFSYEPATGLMTSEINQRGIATTYHYNEWARLESVERADGAVVTVNDSTSEIMSNNFTGGVVGQLAQVGSEELADGIKDAKSNVTTFSKDKDGYVSEITDSEGKVTKVERDLEGRPTKIIRFDDSVVLFTYNEDGDLIKKIDSATEVVIEYVYNQYGQLLGQSDPRGNWAENIYNDTTGLLISSKNQLNQTTTNEYYDLGVLKSRTNSFNQKVIFNYDNNGNLISQLDPLGLETKYERDGAGNVTKVINANNQETINTYDAFNRLLSVKTPKGEITTYQYLATGELAKIIDPLGNETLFSYNILGQMIEKTDPLGFKTKISYDVNGNVTQEIDPNGNIKTFEYDSLDQLVKRILPDNIYEFVYDARGNVSSISDGKTKIDYLYKRNEAGDVVSAVNFEGLGSYLNLPSYEIGYDYDVSGNRTKMITSFGEVNYTYDNGNRLTGLTNHLNEGFSFEYDGGNRLSAINRPGSRSVLSFDDGNFLTSLIHSKVSNSSELSKFAYVRDNIGNRKKMTTNSGVHEYDYDLNNQLTSAVNPDSVDETFSYDEIGNRTTDQDGSYSFEPKKQRLSEDYNFFYSYDNNGNLTTKVTKDHSKTINYSYSSENQLIRIQWYDGTTLTKEAHYLYDALGRRVQKEIIDQQDNTNNFTRKFVYDGNEIIAQLDENNVELTRYTHSGLRTDDVLSVELTQAGVDKNLGTTVGSFQYIKDAQGTVVDLVDNSGSKVQHHAYSAFGKLLKITDGNGNDVTDAPPVAPYFTYTGREWDAESGLYYYRARYLDPSTGRFLTVDPDAGDIRSPITHINKYTYVGNNPVMFVDPSGAIKLKRVLAIAISPGTAIFRPFLNDKYENRLDNIIIASAVVAAAVYTAPVTAGVAAGVTVVQNRNKKGNFFDNLGDFTTDFAFNFAVSYALNGGSDIDPNAAGSLFGFNLPVNALAVEAGTGLTGVFIKETLCNNKKHIPGSLIGDVANGLGFVADRIRTTCD
ncbi:carboxypeptidase regulatory-like domain-containing protein [Bacteriovoracaceae bacterium]|nr:carboxypeptidase regulatory-like domain-containing protein [Bacteriovoracaceae bacterium]